MTSQSNPRWTSQGAARTAALRLRLFGPMEAHLDGRALPLGPPKQQALLAILALHLRQTVSVESLVDQLWGHRPPRTAAHSVQIYVSSLRKLLAEGGGEPVIVTQRPGYRLDLPEDRVDVAHFDLLAEAGLTLLRADAPQALKQLQAALRLWCGEPLTEFTFDDFATEARDRLHSLRVDVLEAVATATLDMGDIPAALRYAEDAGRADPLRDRAQELRMTALYRCGRQADALAAYAQHRARLAEELGVTPGPDLMTLQERILLHDPTLGGLKDPVSMPGSRNPYKGLRPFTEADADDFFGRDRVTDQLVGRLTDGAACVSLVGPSGSGKSSVVAAGLLPRLRAGAVPGSDRWTIVRAAPGDDLAAMVEHGIAMAASPGVGDSTASPAHGRPVSRVRDTGHVLVILDQFEEHLTGEDGARRRLLDDLADLCLRQRRPITVLLTLRADHYDVPLQHPRFAEVFTGSVVNVLPMSPEEVEAAIAAPARTAGRVVEPALVAALVAATADRPAPLPLLQYVLTELCEAPGPLRLSDYRAIGGLSGALARRAERLHEDWSSEQREAATQLFLRLARRDLDDSLVRRRLPLRELAAVRDLDPVALSQVLADLDRYRLITYDRTADHSATVEVAHEALFVEWPWLARLLKRHREALRRHATLVVALEEWEAADRHADYLLRGSRLTECDRWRRSGILQLSGPEEAFLSASAAAAAAEDQAAADQTERERRLRRSARARLTLLGAATVAITVLTAVAFWPTPAPPARVAWVYNGGGFTERLLEDGIDRAATEAPMTLVEANVDVPDAQEHIRRLADAGQDLVLVSTLETDLKPIARDYRDTHFVLLQGETVAPNVTSVGFADQEGAYLAGVAAASASRTGTVAFLGGADSPVVLRMEAGFVAGAEAVDREIRVIIRYVTRAPNYEGFGQPALAAEATRPLLRAGADVVFPAAGGAQFGALQTIVDTARSTGRTLFAVGADHDAYGNAEWQRSTDARDIILTSVVKRFDLAAYHAVRDHASGDLRAGSRTYDVANGGLTLAASAPAFDAVRASVAPLQRRLRQGTVVVPCVPAGVSGAAAVAAAAGSKCPPRD